MHTLFVCTKDEKGSGHVRNSVNDKFCSNVISSFYICSHNQGSLVSIKRSNWPAELTAVSLILQDITKRASPNNFFQNDVILTWGGGGGAMWNFFCQQNVGTNDAVRHRASGENNLQSSNNSVKQFIERYDGRHKGSGKSKAMMISDVYFHSASTF